MSRFVSNSQTRRSFLRVGASSLALPFLETFASAKSVADAPPKRMIFLGNGYGFTKETFYPTEHGKFSEIGLTEGLSPLKRHQDDITMIANLTNLGATDPHGGSTSYLTGANVAGTAGKRFFNSISCDQVAAQYLGNDTRYSHLALANAEDKGGHGKGNSLAWNQQGNPISGIERPLDLYTSLFGGNLETPEERDARLQKKRSILDTVRLDGGEIKRTLSTNDQNKLDEYFQGIREIEIGLQRQAKWSKVPKPDAPFKAPKEDIEGESEIKIMYDMIIAALQTDSTRVITYKQPVESVLKSMGVFMGAHSLSHYGFSVPRKEASRARDIKCAELFGHFLDRLKEAKDIDGSRLFDNCIVSYGTNLRSGHDLRHLPAIISGGGAKDIKHGRHVVLPNEDTPLANLWLTLMQQAGVPVDEFSHSTGIIPEILG